MFVDQVDQEIDHEGHEGHNTEIAIYNWPSNEASLNKYLFKKKLLVKTNLFTNFVKWMGIDHLWDEWHKYRNSLKLSLFTFDPVGWGGQNKQSLMIIGTEQCLGVLVKWS